MTGDARTLITANAGCGKTYTLANRVIGWMIEHMRGTGDIGVDGLLAATFTRKAAGEILERILKHLAQGVSNKERRDEYAETLGIEPPASQAQYAAALESLVDSLDAIQIGTLDSVFHRIAAVCAGEIGLPADWTMATEAQMKAVRLEAVGDFLDTATQSHIDAIVVAAEEEMLRGGGIDKVYEAVWKSGVMQVWQGSLGGGGDAWRWLLELEDAVIAPGASLRSSEAIAAACTALEAAQVAATKAGAPNKTWLKARDTVVALARTGEWQALLGAKIVRAAMTGTPFSRAIAPDRFVDTLRPLFGHASALLARSLKSRMQSWLLLLGGLLERLERLQHETGLYDFADVARHLARAEVLRDASDQWLDFRLDMKMRDIALDEFQDTSVEQFRVLDPVFRELFAGAGGHDEGRHLLVVADEKQSIYGWRGGTPELIETLRAMGGPALHEEERSVSWRSAPAVLAFVDAVFGDLGANPVLLAAEEPPVDRSLLDSAGIGDLAVDRGPIASALAKWPWTSHTSAHAKMSGGVRVHQSAWAGRDDTPSLDMAVDIAASRVPHATSIGILVPTNDQVSAIAARLRARGIDASEEGGAKPKDLEAINAVKDLLHLAEHPGDRLAAFKVSHSAIGPWIGLDPLETIPPDAQEPAMATCARRLRDRILHEGLAAVLADLAEVVRDQCDQRNARALDHLVQLADVWFGDQSSGQPSLSDFIDHAMLSSLGGASDGQVRVMTIHKAKGLEFDEVILPVLQPKLVREDPGCRIVRAGPLEDVRAVAPSVNADVRWASPAMEIFRHQMLQRQYQDRLSGLYVALTRARRGLHLVMQNHGKPIEDTCSAANIIRAAVPAIDQAINDRGQQESGLVWTSGDEAWLHETVSRGERAPRPEPVRMKKAQDIPSQAVESVSIDITSGRPRREGIALHECFAQVEWLDDGCPDAASLDQAFARAATQIGRPVGSDQRSVLTDRFRAALDGPSGAALRRSAHDHWGLDDLVVLCEVPLVHGGSVQRLDRLVLGRHEGVVVRAAILDFKSGVTDRALAETRYRPQLDAYAQRVADNWGLDPADIEADLLLVDV